MAHARQASQYNKKLSLGTGGIGDTLVHGGGSTLITNPEESIEQAMRRSITKPPGNLDMHSSYDSKLRQSMSNTKLDQLSTATKPRANFALKHQSTQQLNQSEQR